MFLTSKGIFEAANGKSEKITVSSLLQTVQLNWSAKARIILCKKSLH